MSAASTPTANRRALPKSKGGCVRCKKRKVKCDERQPTCRNCTRHNVECSYTAVPLNKGRSQVAPDSMSPAIARPREASEYTIHELELLHYYTTSTCSTIYSEPASRNFWRVNVPQIGFTANYILQALFSLTALHLARFRPERRDFYLDQAMLHYNAASAMAAPLVANVTAENCIPLYLFSTITSCFSLARPQEPADIIVASNKEMPSWLYLSRGLRLLLEAHGDMLYDSSLAPLLQPGMKLYEAWRASKFEHGAITELEENVKDAVPDSPKRAALLHATHRLKRSFAIMYEGKHSEDDKITAIFMWLYKINDDYLNLVRNGDSEALCVLAFLSVPLRRMEHYWWVESRGLHLMEQIYSMVDGNYRMWLRWPIEEIGWVPRA
ncbi:hypothetical protein BX600DRAFT_439719 [Xylariales sp. PMI_506]|nr:hypothetical protein BX600DRAFT_439719 [Xylariales sp. PMI_506]